MLLGDLIAIIFCSFLFGIFIFVWLIPFIKTWNRDSKREIEREKYYIKEEEKTKSIIDSIPKNEFYKWKLKMFEVQELFDNLNRVTIEKTRIKNELAQISIVARKQKNNSTYSSLIKREEKTQKQIERIREMIDLKLNELNLSSHDFLNVIDKLIRG